MCSGLPLTRADILHYYAGPSEPSNHYLRIWDFRIIGPSDLFVGDTITVEFTLQNWGQYTLDFTELGMFAAARDPSSGDTSFGFTYQNKQIKPGENVTLTTSRKLDSQGVWVIWPSYQVWWPIQKPEKQLGPDKWHAASLKVSSPKFPDLTVIEVLSDREKSVIGYTIKNTGEAIAAKGHSSALYVDGEEVARDIVQVDLKPGESYTSWFKDYIWPWCLTMKAKVCTDIEKFVKEYNEGNNCLEKVCVSYSVEPRITSGPNVTTTDTFATIVWSTNIRGDSLVNYTDRSTGAWASVRVSNLTTTHQVILSGLRPIAVYKFYVESRDACGNATRSQTLMFETPSPPDKERPTVSLSLPVSLSAVVRLTASAHDNIGVEKVTFFIDGVSKSTDYDPPYELMLNTSAFTNGEYNFSVVAFDLVGNEGNDVTLGTISNPVQDTTNPTVTILYPEIGDSVIGTVRIEASIHDEVGYIQGVKLFIDGTYSRGWTYIPLRFDPFTREVRHEPATGSMAFVAPWNTTGLEPGSKHTLLIEATDDSGNVGHSSINVSTMKFELLTPSLTPMIIDIQVNRSVMRVNNYFLVSLILNNTGTVPLSDIVLIDRCAGFQCTPKEKGGESVAYSPDIKGSTVTCKYILHHGVIEPRHSAVIQYYAVPILYNDITKYEIGFGSTIIRFSVDGTPRARAFVLPHPPPSSELHQALHSADYLIVTCPPRLYEFNPGESLAVDHLLAKTAELARLKLGVLGYLPEDPTPQLLKELISPGGYWASRLSDAFGQPERMNAYLLIVGEANIVPSYDYSDVHQSDHYYADVVGDCRPDLIVGRMIGKMALNLTTPIQSSIDVANGNGFDRSLGLVTSGYEKDDGSPYVPFIDLAMASLEDLQSQGVTTTVVHWSAFLERAWQISFTNYDAMTLGDMDGDGLDEVIVASDEYSEIRIYEPSDGRLVGAFSCRFTRYDGLTAGDLDGDGFDEIVMAVDDDGREGKIYVYKADGTLVTSCECRFNNWDAIDTGDLVGDEREEVVTVSDDQDQLRAYSLDGGALNLVTSWRVSFTPCDGFGVGDVSTSLLMYSPSIKDEVVIASDDDQRIYIYRANGTLLDTKPARFTCYDGFVVSPVELGHKDEYMVVISDDNNRIYPNDYIHITQVMYSKFLDDWFRGIRYTGSRGDERHDAVAIGTLAPSEDPKLVVIRNRNGPTSTFEVLPATWRDADDVAADLFRRFAEDASIIVMAGHGSYNMLHPVSTFDLEHCDFPEHPFVFGVSCLTGRYGHLSFCNYMLSRGAAVYIGSTEESKHSRNEYTLRHYFERWDVWSERAGDAFHRYEREKYGEGGKWVFWVKEYNYYGDPKFPTGG